VGEKWTANSSWCVKRDQWKEKTKKNVRKKKREKVELVVRKEIRN
jgi:hypothetical protein